MAHRIFKYMFSVQDEPIELEMLEDARILRVQVQGDIPCLWALIDDTKTGRVVRTLRTFATGSPIDVDVGRLKHLGTIQLRLSRQFDFEGIGNLVFHVFEEDVYREVKAAPEDQA